MSAAQEKAKPGPEIWTVMIDPKTKKKVWGCVSERDENGVPVVPLLNFGGEEWKAEDYDKWSVMVVERTIRVEVIHPDNVQKRMAAINRRRRR